MLLWALCNSAFLPLKISIEYQCQSDRWNCLSFGPYRELPSLVKQVYNKVFVNQQKDENALLVFKAIGVELLTRNDVNY
jgi:hypothetical protein